MADDKKVNEVDEMFASLLDEVGKPKPKTSHQILLEGIIPDTTPPLLASEVKLFWDVLGRAWGDQSACRRAQTLAMYADDLEQSSEPAVWSRAAEGVPFGVAWLEDDATIPLHVRGRLIREIAFSEFSYVADGKSDEEISVWMRDVVGFTRIQEYGERVTRKGGTLEPQEIELCAVTEQFVKYIDPVSQGLSGSELRRAVVKELRAEVAATGDWAAFFHFCAYVRARRVQPALEFGEFLESVDHRDALDIGIVCSDIWSAQDLRLIADDTNLAESLAPEGGEEETPLHIVET